MAFHRLYGMRTRLLCHTNADFYGIWTAFIGGGGGLQYIEDKVQRKHFAKLSKPFLLNAPPCAFCHKTCP